MVDGLADLATPALEEAKTLATLDELMDSALHRVLEAVARACDLGMEMLDEDEIIAPADAPWDPRVKARALMDSVANAYYDLTSAVQQPSEPRDA